MHEIETWISEAATALGLPLKRKTPAEGRDFVKTAKAIFVDDDPRVWWLGLKLPFKQVSSEGLGLTDVLPSREGACFLIPETDAEELPVYEFDAKNVELVIKECPYFEYYVLAQDLRWLVAESDHNVFFVCERPPAA